MDDNVLRQLASQQYMFHLLVKILLERGILKKGEPENRYSNEEFSEFLHDYLEHLRKGKFYHSPHNRSALPVSRYGCHFPIHLRTFFNRSELHPTGCGLLSLSGHGAS